MKLKVYIYILLSQDKVLIFIFFPNMDIVLQFLNTIGLKRNFRKLNVWLTRVCKCACSDLCRRSLVTGQVNSILTRGSIDSAKLHEKTKTAYFLG